MWYSCTTLALELKIEWLYKRDDKVVNMFYGGVWLGGMIIEIYIPIQLQN